MFPPINLQKFIGIVVEDEIPYRSNFEREIADDKAFIDSQPRLELTTIGKLKNRTQRYFSPLPCLQQAKADTDMSDSYPTGHPLLSRNPGEEPIRTANADGEGVERYFDGLKIPSEFPIPYYCEEMLAEERRRQAVLDAKSNRRGSTNLTWSGTADGGQDETEDDSAEQLGRREDDFFEHFDIVL